MAFCCLCEQLSQASEAHSGECFVFSALRCRTKSQASEQMQVAVALGNPQLLLRTLYRVPLT